MSSRATYKGLMYEVRKKDKFFVSLEGWGMKIRVPCEEVIYDKEPEPELAETYEDKHEIVEAPTETPLLTPDSRKETELFPGN
jgi:hypothetical protein